MIVAYQSRGFMSPALIILSVSDSYFFAAFASFCLLAFVSLLLPANAKDHKNAGLPGLRRGLLLTRGLKSTLLFQRFDVHHDVLDSQIRQ